jgi:hypothetical protein
MRTGTEPHCVKAIVIWQHGNYTIQPNNVGGVLEKAA